MAGHSELTHWLIGHGANPGATDVMGRTALTVVAGVPCGLAGAVATLLAGKADPDVADAVGFTALHHAIVHQRSSIVVRLCGADPTLIDFVGLAARDYARIVVVDSAAHAALRRC